MSCPMFKTKGPKMAENQFPTQFPLKHQQKDMRLALALAKNKGVTLPTANTANENYKKVSFVINYFCRININITYF